MRSPLKVFIWRKSRSWCVANADEKKIVMKHQRRGKEKVWESKSDNLSIRSGFKISGFLGLLSF
jgi:hypothetical protein